ncbi:MAG: TPM domain-containing protein [Catalinimonas sp.]
MPKAFFTPDEQSRIVAAIREAELRTSGEIQVHLEPQCKGEVLDRAADVFAKLKMHRTERRNGVLFYLATETHCFAILGDKGINRVVPGTFWDAIKDQLTADFKAGDFAGGLIRAIGTAGEQLRSHFPRQADDVNELPDDISFGK